MRPPSRTVRLCAAAATTVLAGCAGGPGFTNQDADPATAPPTSAMSTSAASTSATSSSAAGAQHPQVAHVPVATPVPEPASTWRAGPGEVQPQIKTMVTHAIEVAGAWPDGGASVAGIEQRLAGLTGATVRPEAARALAQHLARPDARSVDIVYPQYGGLTRTQASVMVVLDQHLVDGGRELVRNLSFDIRLHRTAAGWQLTQARLPEIDPRPSWAPTALAQQVLDNPDIGLPEAARSDIRAGRVQPQTLRVMGAVAARHRIDVSVLVSAHPREVFGTTRESKHHSGRAVDIWRIDGHPVVDPRTPRGLIVDVMRAASRAGANGGIGAPFLPRRPPPGAFTNALHADHVHLAVKPVTSTTGTASTGQ